MHCLRSSSARGWPLHAPPCWSYRRVSTAAKAQLPKHSCRSRSIPPFLDCKMTALPTVAGKYWLNGSLHLSVTSLVSRDGALRVEGISPAQLCRCPSCIDSRCDGSPTILVGDPSPPGGVKGYEGAVPRAVCHSCSVHGASNLCCCVCVCVGGGAKAIPWPWLGTSGVVFSNLFISGARTAVRCVNAAGCYEPLPRDAKSCRDFCCTPSNIIITALQQA